MTAASANLRGFAWRLDRLWRQFGTAMSFFIFGLAGVGLGLTLYPIACLSTRNKETAKRRAQYLTYRAFYTFSRIMRAFGVISWEIHGAEKLLIPGQMIIANHPTLIDVVLLIGYIPKVDCIIKEALFRNPFTSLPVTWSGYISNSTPTQLVADCTTAMKSGNSLVIFPEGTRSKPGQPIRIPHGTARIALESGVPILPVIINCEPIMLTKGSRFWNVPPRPGHFTIRVGEAYSAQPFLDAAPNMAIAARRLSLHWEDEFARHTGRSAIQKTAR